VPETRRSFSIWIQSGLQRSGEIEKMVEQSQKGNALNDELVSTQISKTKLEIKELEKPKRTWIATYIPLITTLVLVGGLVFSIYQAQEASKKGDADRIQSENARQVEQTKERLNKIEAQVRADKERLLEFYSDKKLSNAWVVFLLDDLSGLIAQLPGRDDEEKKVTDLLGAVVWELGFDERWQIDFDLQALQRWPAYKAFWMNNGPAHHLLLSKKYYPAIANEYSRDAVCVKTLNFDEKRRIFTAPRADNGC
jgi:hypothetical protein